jgi:hypothetical protein
MPTMVRTQHAGEAATLSAIAVLATPPFRLHIVTIVVAFVFRPQRFRRSRKTAPG